MKFNVGGIVVSHSRIGFILDKTYNILFIHNPSKDLLENPMPQRTYINSYDYEEIEHKINSKVWTHHPVKLI